MSTKLNESPAAVLGQKMKKFFRYRKDATVHQFLAYQINGNLVMYSTDKAVFNCSTSTFFSEMADWNPATEAEVGQLTSVQVINSYEPKLPELPAGMGQAFTAMFDTLQFAIDKVKSDPKFVEQANAINGLAKTSVDVARTQLEAYKVLVLPK